LNYLVVKVYAWEKPFTERIKEYRNQEIKALKKAGVLRAANEAFFFVSPTVISTFAFVTTYLVGDPLSADKVFTSLTLLNIVRLTMCNFFPKGMQFMSESRVSMNRIQQFLSLPEIGKNQNDEVEMEILNEKSRDTLIVMKNASFSWQPLPQPSTMMEGKQLINDEKYLIMNESEGDLQGNELLERKLVLTNINLEIKEKSLTGIVGPVGSGKSSFLNALLRELDPVTGSFAIRKNIKVAYASQVPWIISGSIKDNIVFGQEYDPIWFNHVLEACCLDRDIESLEGGINVVIGEKGVTLSGGIFSNYYLFFSIHFL